MSSFQLKNELIFCTGDIWSIIERTNLAKLMVDSTILGNKFIFSLKSIAKRRKHLRSTVVIFQWNRRGWDSNPRYPSRYGDFQDRCLKPLGHPSTIHKNLITYMVKNFLAFFLTLRFFYEGF